MGKSKIEKLNNEFDVFFNKVTEENFYKMYDEFKLLVIGEKDNFSKKEILEILFNYNQNNELNDYQEEVLTEIENRIFGYCSPVKDIQWD